MSTAVAIPTQDSTYELLDQGRLNDFRYPEPNSARATMNSKINSALIEKPFQQRSANAYLTQVLDLNEPREEIKQQWSGVVTSIDINNLTVQLQDLTNPQNPNEIIVLSRDEIDNKDQPLIQVGAQFYWSIGYRQGIKYSKQRFSNIRFRRLPKWSAGEIKAAEILTEEYADFFLAD